MVKGFSGLKENELPHMYRYSNKKTCWVDNDSLHIYNCAVPLIKISRGDFLTCDEVDNIDSLLKESAKNLKDVNKKLDNIRSEWNKDMEFIY